MRPAVLLLIAACGGKPPAPVLANVTPPPSAIDAAVGEPDAGEECTSTDAPLAATTVELIVCQTGDQATSERSREQGFVEKLMRADLVLHPASGAAISTTIASWTDGWEWGTTWSLVGELGDAILLTESSSGPSPGISALAGRVRAFAIVGGAWQEVGGVSNNTLEVVLSPDHATVTTCGGGQSATPAGCGGFPDADPGPTYELRWDGSAVVATTPNP